MKIAIPLAFLTLISIPQWVMAKEYTGDDVHRPKQRFQTVAECRSHIRNEVNEAAPSLSRIDKGCGERIAAHHILWLLASGTLPMWAVHHRFDGLYYESSSGFYRFDEALNPPLQVPWHEPDRGTIRPVNAAEFALTSLSRHLASAQHLDKTLRER